MHSQVHEVYKTAKPTGINEASRTFLEVDPSPVRTSILPSGMYEHGWDSINTRLLAVKQCEAK